MTGQRTRRTLIGAIISSATWLAVAGAAADPQPSAHHHQPPHSGPPSFSYRGRTSQHQTISFTISGGHVRQLAYSIIDKCGGETSVSDHDAGFPPIQIKHSRFGGTFVDHQHAATAVVKGSVSGRRVSGSLSDAVRFHHHNCHGSANFSLTPS